MKEATINRIGQVLRYMQMPVVRRALSPENYIRVTYTHYVKNSDIENFRAIVQYLLKAYHMITPNEFFQFMSDQKGINGKHMLMTFDDGLKSSYEAAKKVLNPLNIKAIFFIPTKILELKSKEDMKNFIKHNVYYDEIAEELITNEEALTMTPDEIKDLHRDGHMILPHTHDHQKLIDIQDDQSVEKQIIQPKRILEELLITKISAFAFPIGTEKAVSSYVFPTIKNEYQYCFSGLAGLNTLKTNPYFLYRDCVHAHYDVNHVQNVTDGVFDFYYHLKMFSLKRRLSSLER